MKIKELLTDESKWTKGFAARDFQGEPIKAEDELATCWCLLGAYFRCYPMDGELSNPNSVYQKLKKGVQTKTRFTEIAAFNDNPNTTFNDIRKLVEELDI